MESPEDENETEKRQELAELALNFLKAVANMAKAELGDNLMQRQRSSWIVRTEPGFWGSKDFERGILNSTIVSQMYVRVWQRNSFREQQRLEEALSKANIPATSHLAGFCLPLLNNWLRMPESLAFEKSVISSLLDEFADAVLKRLGILRSRFVIDNFDPEILPISLEKGVIIRQITNDELWEFGDIERSMRYIAKNPFYYPNESWKILDIKLQYRIPFEIRELLDFGLKSKILPMAVLALFRLGASGSTRIINLGSEKNYGNAGSEAWPFSAFNNVQEIGAYEETYSLNAEEIRHLQNSWQNMRKIMESDNHYLRLPAQRLLEGGLRERPEDAILDYAIGLERLLTEGDKKELGYRFALRGATVLSWNGGNKKIFFDRLKKFYDVRSSIVHGSRVKENELSDSCVEGENYLRKIWWWYFEHGFIQEKGLKKGTDEIEKRILSNSIGNVSCRGSRYEEKSL